ncbi:MAG: hypothetical protein HKN91_13950 [Acidimicrobiia bacterium]|nr:hypothetical protein [Acidimicrobiia bacterium]
MASSKTKTDKAELEDVDSPEEIEGELEEPTEDAIEADVDADDDSDWSEDDDDDDSDDADDEEGETTEDLDELESEELEMLTEDELSETLVVDEAAELRAIRRAELAMSGETGTERGDGEFLCQGCFLVLSTSQLTDKRRKLCSDCAG